MNFILSLLSNSPGIYLPQNWLSYLGWLLLAGGTGYLVYRWRKFDHFNRRWVLFVNLLISACVTGLFAGITLSIIPKAPIESLPLDPHDFTILVLSAIPWMLAAGLLGPSFAVLVALTAGIVQSFWLTHNIFTPLELSLLAVLFAAAINQRYRTTAYRWLRKPILSALLVACVFPIVHIYVWYCLLWSEPLIFLEAVTLNLPGRSAVVLVECLVAGLVVHLVSRVWMDAWGLHTPLVPSPPESSLRAHFLYRLTPMLLALMILLMIGIWIIAGFTARTVLRVQMANLAEITDQNLPYFIGSGQDLIRELAKNPALAGEIPEELSEILAASLHRFPFFNQLYLFNADGDPITGYPSKEYDTLNQPTEEQTGILIARQAVTPQVQSYVIKPRQDGETARMTFISRVPDNQGRAAAVLVGHTDFATNPFAEPLWMAMQGLDSYNGWGVLLDQNNRILIHPEPALLMETAPMAEDQPAGYYQETTSQGKKNLVYYQPIKMNSWGVLFSVPTYQIQLMTLSISAPLLGLVALVALGTMLVINQGVNSISYSIKNLSDQALQLSRGELERAFPEGGEDEIGDLQRSFEYLRISLKNRLDELNRLLSVSLGIASNLELANAIQPILEAALVGGACSARIVILPMVVPEMESSPALPLRFSAGPARELYADLDDQILGYTRQQQRLVLTSLTRPRLMNVTKNSPQPASLLAYSLQGEKEFYGALWIGFDRTHRFDNEEIRYISTLASQASLAISHAKHYLNAEVGRQRLAAILDSSPDPVLVTDQNNRLIIANPAAWTALGLGINYDQGQPIEQVLSQKDLVELLKDRDNSQKSIEVTSRDGLVYLAMATPVIAEGEIVGRVCILRDVTQFKELDALKTEFVANVSHDLREPLSHIRGYTTMLEMVGPLNEQQSGYVKKIVSNVDSMSHLINNLLDLSRIGAGIDLQVEKTTVPELIEPVITALQMQAVQKRIDLSVHLPDEPLPRIEVDTTLLHQALYNLVENAIKFTRVDGKVTISFELSPGQVTFVVTDTGVGIGPMDQPRVFEPFYRIAQPSAKDPPGAGLGLAIVKSIAERHRGQAWVKSQLGKGSKFYMSVPIVHAKTTRKN